MISLRIKNYKKYIIVYFDLFKNCVFKVFLIINTQQLFSHKYQITNFKIYLYI